MKRQVEQSHLGRIGTFSEENSTIAVLSADCGVGGLSTAAVLLDGAGGLTDNATVVRVVSTHITVDRVVSAAATFAAAARFVTAPAAVDRLIVDGCSVTIGGANDYQEKLRNRAALVAQVRTSEGSSAREKSEAAKEAAKIAKTLHECEEWERQTILPLAQARIALDLDDGVKVNYLKLGEALAPIPGLESKGED